MRFTVKPYPKHGDTRIVKRFVFACEIKNEIRLLEIARILQRFEHVAYVGARWVNVEWVDDDDE